MPIDKAAIGAPMALVPKVPTKPTSANHPNHPPPRHSPSHQRIISKGSQHEIARTMRTTHREPVATIPRHERVTSHATFPPSTHSPNTSPMNAPANTPRIRHHSDAARLTLSPRQSNDGQPSSQLNPAAIGVECSTSLINECFQVFADCTTLLKACQELRTYTFSRLSGIYLTSIDRYLRKLETYPNFVKESSVVQSAVGSVEFAEQVVKNFIDALPREVPQEKQQETALHMASLAVMIWECTKVLMRVSYQEELYYSVSKQLRPRTRTEAAEAEADGEVQSDTQEVAEVAAMLKKSLIESSADSLKALKASIMDYFHRLSRPSFRVRKSPRQEVDESAAYTVKTRAAMDSFILIDTAITPSTLSSSVNKLNKLNKLNKPSVEPSEVEPPRARTGLRESLIFFSAASTIVTTPIEPGFDVKTFRSLWCSPVSDSDVVKEMKRDPTTGKYREVINGATFPALVQFVLENSDNSDNADFVDAFFLFFRIHARPRAFLDALMTFYNQASPASRSLHRSSYRSYRRYGKMQVVKVLALWVTIHWNESQDKDLREALFKFIHDVVAIDRDLPCNMGSLLVSAFDRRAIPTPEQKVKRDRSLYPRTSFQVHLDHMEEAVSRGLKVSLVDIVIFHEHGGAEEIARGLTILESEHFHSFLPGDIVGLKSGCGLKQFKDWERFSAALGWWILNSILSHKSADKRIKAYELFVNVAHICMEMRNFSSAQAIAQALKNIALNRLAGTIGFVSSGHTQRLERIEEFFWGINGYQAAMKERLPAIPVPFLIKHDVVEANKAYSSHANRRTKSGERMIEMYYYIGIRRTIRDMERVYGQMPIPRVKVILQWIEGACKPYLDADFEDMRTETMAKSFALEPAQPNLLRPRASWVTEEDRKRAYLDGFLP